MASRLILPLLGLATLLVLALPGLALRGGPASGDGAPRDVFVLVLAEGAEEVGLRGHIVVDGEMQVIERASTPWQLVASPEQIVSGELEVTTPGRTIRLRIFDPRRSPRWPAASASRTRYVRFAWSPPGAGARCVDTDRDPHNGCPDWVPGMPPS